MKIIEASLYALRIPFVETFSHSIQSRTYSDSIVVRLRAADGTVGYGEAVARPYVTGETVESCLQFMAEKLWPVVQATNYLPWDGQDPLAWLSGLTHTMPFSVADGVIAWNAARCGFELALVDCLLKVQQLSLAKLLPPLRSTIIYSGVITASTVEGAVTHAKRFRKFGLPHLKIKVTGAGDVERMAAIRATVGPDRSLRIDGNGAYTLETALATCQSLAPFKIDSAEQMLPRGDIPDLVALQAASPIPQMVDESLITLTDAQALIDAQACGFFNLRLSKCGGLAQTIEIAKTAESAGMPIQLGCQVGETAILSAAGRHLAAYLPSVTYTEGSYGSLLLSEDLSRNPIHFGHGGRAKILRGQGLGVEVQETVLQKYGSLNC